MAKLVDVEDVKECVKIGIKRGWSLDEFLESIKLWADFVEWDKWTPLTESQPKADGTYLVTIDGSICGEDGPITSMCGFYDGKWDEEGYVIAWKPLPKAYKAG